MTQAHNWHTSIKKSLCLLVHLLYRVVQSFNQSLDRTLIVYSFLLFSTFNLSSSMHSFLLFCNFVVLFGTISGSFINQYRKHKCFEDDGDPGAALYLTKYIECGDIKTVMLFEEKKTETALTVKIVLVSLSLSLKLRRIESE